MRFESEIEVDAAFPGGNVLVQRIDDRTVYVAPDLRDTQKGEWWFYWNFRLRAPENQPVTVVFTEKNPIGVRGPAVSTDAGATWSWMGASAVKSMTMDGKQAWAFQTIVPPGASEARFAFCIPHVQSNFDAFLKRHEANPALRREELCRSRKGRVVELVRAGNLERPRSFILVTARHHCCEAMGSYALEGVLDAALADDDPGRRLRERWQLIAIPFVDKNGVEEGDQGKHRAPHDHNRDYNAGPLYPEVAAIMNLGDSLKGRVFAMLDLHCPGIRGEWNDHVYFVGPESEKFWQAELTFARTLERVQRGSIRFRAADCLPFGTAWNTGANWRQGRHSGRWARETFPDAMLAAVLEIPYADARGDEVNAESARALGRDVARVLAEY